MYAINQSAARFALVALAAATVAMLTLHGVQRALNPLKEPVSYYVHGDHGWLLSVALDCFGAAAVAIAFARRREVGKHPGSWSLVVFGAGMILAGIVPSDRWFPWEAMPSLSGVVHAAASVLSPPILLIPMLNHLRRYGSRWRGITLICIVAYAMGLIGSALALAIGFAVDAPPPLIGLSERVLALSGVTWLTAAAIETGTLPASSATPR